MIILLSAVQAISSKASHNSIDVFGYKTTKSEERWDVVSMTFGFILDLIAILCLYLLVLALKTIFQKVKQET